MCGRTFGCHSCVSSLRQFIEVAGQVEVLRKQGFLDMAFKELKSAAELARVIAYTSEDKEMQHDSLGSK